MYLAYHTTNFKNHLPAVLPLKSLTGNFAADLEDNIPELSSIAPFQTELLRTWPSLTHNNTVPNRMSRCLMFCL